MTTTFPQYKHAQVADLIPYARNSRTHSGAQIDKIAASIKEFGFLNPVIIDGENGIIAGHGRIMAAKKLGMETVPVVEADHLTDAQRRAYVIADNRLALDAGWDDELLRVEFAELDDIGFDLELTGFTIDEIDWVMAQDEKITEATKTLQPMSMTHMLVSIPNGAKVEGLEDAISAVKQAGGRVDYGGN